jgi:hypothetical protein
VLVVLLVLSLGLPAGKQHHAKPAGQNVRKTGSRTLDGAMAGTESTGWVWAGVAAPSGASEKGKQQQYLWTCRSAGCAVSEICLNKGLAIGQDGLEKRLRTSLGLAVWHSP